MLLAGGCGDTNSKPQIDKTEYLQEAYETLFSQTETELSDIAWTEYDGCNHSLECNDALKNIDILKDVM